MASDRHIRPTQGLVSVAIFLCLLTIPFLRVIDSRISLTDMQAMPSWSHPLGTDVLGRDLLLRLSEAVTSAVVPVWTSVLAATAAGTVIMSAMLAGSERWWVCNLACGFVSRTCRIASSLPVGIATFGAAAWNEQAGIGPLIAMLFVLVGSRSVQQVQDLFAEARRLGYWEAHRAMGGSGAERIIRYGICGVWRRPLLDSLAFHLRITVAIEASLSYLGFGVQEPAPSFGNMLASHFDGYLKGHWHTAVVITTAMMVCAQVPANLLHLTKALWRWAYRSAATARQIHPVIKANPPTGVTMPSARTPEKTRP